MRARVLIPWGTWGPRRAPNHNVNNSTLICYLILVLDFGTTILSSPLNPPPPKKQTKIYLTNS